MSEFKRRFKHLRNTLGWSQSECAKHLGFTPAAISHFETGIREPELRNFVKICKGFKTTPNILLGFEGPEICESDLEKRVAVLEQKLMDHTSNWQDHSGRIIGGGMK